MRRSPLHRGMFLYALSAIALTLGLAAFGQQAPRLYDAVYMQSLKARVFLADPSLDFVRYAPKAKGSPCRTFDHGFLVVFRYQGTLYEAAFYCDTPGMHVMAGERIYGDRDLDGRIDLVFEDDLPVFYDYAIVTSVTLGLERRPEFQHEYDRILRLLDRILPSSV